MNLPVSSSVSFGAAFKLNLSPLISPHLRLLHLRYSSTNPFAGEYQLSYILDTNTHGSIWSRMLVGDCSRGSIEVALSGDGGDDGPTPGYSTGSEVSSLSSRISDYKYENGRRYHSFREGSYVLPNDALEQERLDIWHHVDSIVLGGELTMAPLDEPQKILDLGTGTGIWAIDAADRYPAALVIGNDLSPIQPTWAPPNCTFEVDDVESEWVYPENIFDLVHSRYMLGSIKDWDEHFCRVFRHVKPGGYLEVKEGVLTFYSQRGPCPENAAKFLELLREAGHKSGRPMVGVEGFKAKIEAAGFQDIEEACIEMLHSLKFGTANVARELTNSRSGRGPRTNDFRKSARIPKSRISRVCRPTAQPYSLASSGGHHLIQPGFSSWSARISETIVTYSIPSVITWLGGNH